MRKLRPANVEHLAPNHTKLHCACLVHGLIVYIEMYVGI